MITNIHIERLILDGLSVSYHQQAQLHATIEMELGNLFANNILPDSLMQDGVLSDISAGDIQLTYENDPVGLGQEIARAVYGGFSR